MQLVRYGRGNSYTSVHEWMNYHYGKPSICESETCTGRSVFYQWANISGKYLKERSDWKRLCKSCHNLMDKRKPICKRGHLQTESNTRFSKFKRYCKDCDRAYYQEKKRQAWAKACGVAEK